MLKWRTVVLNFVNLGERMSSPAIPSQSMSFGPFCLLPEQGLLLEKGKPLHIGSRAFEILNVLVERAGDLVSKDELIGRVWPDTNVEECALRVHVHALRKALGDGRAGHRYIVNVTGRGYRFVSPVSRASESGGFVAQTNAGRPAHNMPTPLTRIVGREAITSALVVQLPEQRFITLVGAGGIGKTTVALAVADALVGNYKDGVWYVDFAPVESPAAVPYTLSSILGVAVRPKHAAPDLVNLLRDRNLLLLLDSCDRLVESVGAFAVQLLRAAPGLHILATSREPLRADGEHVQRLAPLEVPPGSRSLTASEALTFPAVQLFAQCAAASLGSFELTDSDAAVVAHICRRLDGIALAIELVVGHIDTFGVRGLAAALEKLPLLTRGKRTTASRHQTLNASLDWSYEMLSVPERIILRRIAIFEAFFTLDAAVAIAADSTIATVNVFEAVDSLVTKSLVTADVGGETVYYRLLETTRAYALGKLIESGKLGPVAQRHAQHLEGVLRRAGLQPDGSPMPWIK